MDKNYVGSGWEKTFDNGGSIINVKLKVEDIAELPQDDYGNISIKVCQRKEPDPKSKATHYVIEDTYKPKQTQ